MSTSNAYGIDMTTRDDLLKAAMELLDAAGPEGVTLRAVGARAGVSHNAPYKHFRDKEALLASVAAHELDRLGVTIAASAAASASPLSALRAVAEKYVDWAQRHPNRFRLVFGRWTRHDDRLAQAAEATQRLFVELVAKTRGRELFPLASDERTAALILALSRGAAEQSLTGHLARDGKGQASPTDLIADLLDLLARH